MDTTAPDYLRHRLQRYEGCIDRTRGRIGNLQAFGNLSASAPYSEQCALPVLLDSLTGMPAEAAALREEYARITRKLDVLVRESGSFYRESLMNDLTTLAHAYHAAACHASICNLPEDAATDACRRRLINLLLAELRSDHDVTGIDALLSVIDDNLRGSVTVPDHEAAGTPSLRTCFVVTDPDHGSSHTFSRQIRID